MPRTRGYSREPAADRRDHLGAAPARERGRSARGRARTTRDGARAQVPRGSRASRWHPGRPAAAPRPGDPVAPLEPLRPPLDAFEVALARAADRRGIPTLGICRGAQAINISRGGTLHQHLPEVTDGTIVHRQTIPGDKTCHDVTIAPGSMLGEIVGPGRLAVNSFHHQAIDLLGRGLRAVAWAPDGTVEGVEAAARPFLLGVQWHAETLVAHRRHRAIFKRLVLAAQAHAEGQSRADAA
ncbi:MAG: gamma-glutamyl-gamma-aminobutyrate hydrolase family protein [Actinobacteria bacterium]|nr:gamma-glutamyl-gamma-aminobutyrate hydrolase family protein [Actinomycetota bacterium]